MSKYFGYKGDIDDLRDSSSMGKLGVLGKMALKTVANVGIFAVTDLPKHALESLANDSTKPEEARKKAREALDGLNKLNRK